MQLQTFTVKGMTCEHCVAAVTEELRRLDGVDAVQIDLSTGQAIVSSESPLEVADVAAAVDEAGYELVQ
ncbi:MAG: heavy-metal-associated domain-containing protein [Acidothermaceae bacterium]